MYCLRTELCQWQLTLNRLFGSRLLLLSQNIFKRFKNLWSNMIRKVQILISLVIL